MPVVNVWLNSPEKNLPGVFPDFEAAGRMAAGHLLARGFRHFGYLGFRRGIDSQRLLAGFQWVTGLEGFPCSVHKFARTSIEENSSCWETFVAGLEAWIDTWETPIGIFAANDLCCRYLIDVCRSKGLHVSQDMAIVGATNESTICTSPTPTLTSIDMGYAQIGCEAAAMLDRLMDGGTARVKTNLVAPVELIPRQSTDSFAASDPLVARAQRFIAEHGQERIHVNDVVAAMEMPRRTLERRFRDSTGRGVAEEITRLRLERAKRCMIETDIPLRAVARESGFPTADRFYKVFTRVVGGPPTRYREENRVRTEARAC